MNDIIHRCVVCEADFTPGGLDKAGKCSSCRIQYPTVKTRQEAFALNRPELHLGAKLTEERVRQIAREEFNAIRAEIKAKTEVMKMAQETAVVSQEVVTTVKETNNG